MQTTPNERESERNSSGYPEQRRERHDPSAIVDKQWGQQRDGGDPTHALDEGQRLAFCSQKTIVASPGPPSFCMRNLVGAVAVWRRDQASRSSSHATTQ